MRDVFLLHGFAIASPAPGVPAEGFDPIASGVPRKHIKTMTRAVQLGVAAVHRALQGAPGWAEIAPERRGLYVGASPQSGDAEDIVPAVTATGPEWDPAGFAERGIPLIPPLWLVKGLSNNVLGYASAQHDFRGDNGNWCDGRLGGAVALCAAVHAIAEGRVDLAVAGGSDAFVGADAVLGQPGGEAAAFVVLAAAGAGRLVRASVPTVAGGIEDLGELGAATVPLAFVRAWAAGGPAAVGGLTLF